MTDISHDMALPCSGHVGVAMPVWSVQAGVAAFSVGKALLPPDVLPSAISPRDTAEGFHLL